MIDVLIPTKNCAEDLDNCLASLALQTIPVNVIIIDAHSTDGTQKTALTHCATLLDEPPSKVKGSRRAVALNEGLHHCRNRYVATLDADTLVPIDWAETLLNYMETHPNVDAATTGNNYAPQGHREKAMLLISKLLSNHAREYSQETIIPSVPGYNAIYRRTPELSYREDLGGCEDYELNQRLGPMMGISGAPVQHIERKNMAAYAKQVYGYGWSRGRYEQLTRDANPKYLLPALLCLAFCTVFPIWAMMLAAVPVALMTLDQDISKNGTILSYIYVPYVFMLNWAVGYIAGWLQ